MPTDRDRFETWARGIEPRLRAALSARLGPQRGSEATAEALVYAWKHFGRVEQLEHPVGYLFKVGRSRTRVRRRRRVGSVLVGGTALLAAVLAAGAVLSETAEDPIPVTAGGSNAGNAPAMTIPEEPDEVRIAPVDQVPDDRVLIAAGNLFMHPENSAGVEDGPVRAGWVELTLTNSQSGQHWLEIEELSGFRLEVYEEGDVDAAVVWLEPGTYTLFDPTPGHRAAGDEAWITVVPASEIDAEAALPTTG